jgi:RNA polymerase sigma-70 factor (ECF subfamily)
VNRVTGESDVHDAELIAQAQRGDGHAFGMLVTRYQDRIYSTCYRMCSNADDAADLTQTAFVKAFEALPRFEARANFFTWLYRIAVNLILSERRTRLRRPRLVRDDGADAGVQREPAAPDGDPQQPALTGERRRRVESALQQLDEEFRAAVVLSDIEELDYATISEILGVPVGTVKSRIHRGRTLLRELLKGEFENRGCA